MLTTLRDIHDDDDFALFVEEFAAVRDEGQIRVIYLSRSARRQTETSAACRSSSVKVIEYRPREIMVSAQTFRELRVALLLRRCCGEASMRTI